LNTDKIYLLLFCCKSWSATENNSFWVYIQDVIVFRISLKYHCHLMKQESPCLTHLTVQLHLFILNTVKVWTV